MLHQRRGQACLRPQWTPCQGDWPEIQKREKRWLWKEEQNPDCPGWDERPRCKSATCWNFRPVTAVSLARKEMKQMITELSHQNAIMTGRLQAAHTITSIFDYERGLHYTPSKSSTHLTSNPYLSLTQWWTELWVISWTWFPVLSNTQPGNVICSHFMWQSVWWAGVYTANALRRETSVLRRPMAGCNGTEMRTMAAMFEASVQSSTGKHCRSPCLPI